MLNPLGSPHSVPRPDQDRPRTAKRPPHGNSPPGMAFVEASEKVLTEIRWTICADNVARPVFRHASTGKLIGL